MSTVAIVTYPNRTDDAIYRNAAWWARQTGDLPAGWIRQGIYVFNERGTRIYQNRIPGSVRPPLGTGFIEVGQVNPVPVSAAASGAAAFPTAPASTAVAVAAPVAFSPTATSPAALAAPAPVAPAPQVGPMPYVAPLPVPAPMPAPATVAAPVAAAPLAPVQQTAAGSGAATTGAFAMPAAPKSNTTGKATEGVPVVLIVGGLAAVALVGVLLFSGKKKGKRR